MRRGGLLSRAFPPAAIMSPVLRGLGICCLAAGSGGFLSLFPPPPPARGGVHKFPPSPQQRAGVSQFSTLPDDAYEETLRLRSQGQPYSEFPSPRAHGKREHAGDAHHRESQALVCG